ncbi:MAG TPA: aldo/keto reductase [Candidatus Fusicatenibacter merdavium]|uniref:Aldo/keto reductase n=1 Tax=Candidatus Fusicatenibacter merdavium TaxID=2838600 RepID=A0A9D1XB69_9FIRM|nr:aldo/keto reductase [Candidatus Fusicatenibacter merdavium]
MNKLGFGFLRLPVLEKDGDIDLERLNGMVDTFLQHGRKYFDTAYTYLDGKSEWAIRESVVKRHSREEFLLADKLPGYMMKSYDDCRRCFEFQLERCGVDYFDVYLLHWLNGTNDKIAEKYREFEFLQELKRDGKARIIGFSFHDTADLLDEILTSHPEVDVVQLQINYLDWNSESVQARLCYETAVRHGKKVIVMEPVKGGTLADVPPEAARVLHQVDPAAGAASLAVRFASSLPEVEIVLSGMNTMDQLLDNLRETEPLGKAEMEKMIQVAENIHHSIAVPCTGCGYCLSGCPKQICIPRYFKLYNEYFANPGDDWKIRPAYERLALKYGSASDCIDCKSCEYRCPQKLSITEYLKKVAETF